MPRSALHPRRRFSNISLFPPQIFDFRKPLQEFRNKSLLSSQFFRTSRGGAFALRGEKISSRFSATLPSNIYSRINHPLQWQGHKEFSIAFREEGGCSSAQRNRLLSFVGLVDIIKRTEIRSPRISARREIGSFPRNVNNALR